MNTANVFARTLSLEEVRQQAPAVFASGARDGLSSRYTFIPTQTVLSGLMGAGFVAVEARQGCPYRASPMFAPHMLRLRRRYESISVAESVPEIRLWNAHDGSAAYQLRMSIWRAVCANGLIVSKTAFPAVYVAHRGNVVDEVVMGALTMSERFDLLATEVEQMERRRLEAHEQMQFAKGALAIRFPGRTETGVDPSQLLAVQRAEDVGDDLYRVFNRVQEKLMSGGLSLRSESGRLTRTRRLTSLKEDVRINSALWDLAREVLAA